MVSVSPKMDVAASYRSPAPGLKDAIAAHGSKHPCRSHLLGSVGCTKTLLHSSMANGLKLTPGHIQLMGQWLVLMDSDHLTHDMVPCLALHIV